MNNLKKWAIFSTAQKHCVAKDLTKKEAVAKRVQLMGTVEFSNDTLKLTTEVKQAG